MLGATVYATVPLPRMEESLLIVIQLELFSTAQEQLLLEAVTVNVVEPPIASMVWLV